MTRHARLAVVLLMAAGGITLAVLGGIAFVSDRVTQPQVVTGAIAFAVAAASAAWLRRDARGQR